MFYLAGYKMQYFTLQGTKHIILPYKVQNTIFYLARHKMRNFTLQGTKHMILP